MRTTHKITCEEASRLISSGMDRELPAPARANLHLHFAVCQACKRFEQQMLFLRSALRGMRAGDEQPETAPPPETPPREGADRR